MTRTEKLATVDAKYLPLIETKRIAMEDAQANLNNKTINWEEKKLEYTNKVVSVNTYYDAREKILELQALTEPEV
jgi:hypothetical protein